MNFTEKNKKIILYLLIPVISILLFYFLIKSLILFIPLIIPLYQLATIFVFSLLTTAYIIFGIPLLIKKFDLQPRNDLLEFLSSVGLKIRYYNMVIIILKLWNVSAYVVIISIFIQVLIGIINLFIPNIIDFSGYQALLLKSNLDYFVFLINFIYLLLISFAFFGIAFFSLIFPNNKISGLPDASDMPISFIRKAIDKIDSFDLTSTWDGKQQIKIQIINLLNNSLEFITLKDKLLGIPQGLRYYQPFIAGLKNKSLKKDISYRINGLSEKLNKIVIQLNYMNTIEEKEKILEDLTNFLNIIENRKLQEIEKVEYKKEGNIEIIIRKIEPYKNLIVIIVIIFVSIKYLMGVFLN